MVEGDVQIRCHVFETVTPLAIPFRPRPARDLGAVEPCHLELFELFKDEDELRALWGRPDTRRALLEGLADKGYGDEELTAIRGMIDAEHSDLYDVLAYIAFALAPISRAGKSQHPQEPYIHPVRCQATGIFRLCLSPVCQRRRGGVGPSQITRPA